MDGDFSCTVAAQSPDISGPEVEYINDYSKCNMTVAENFTRGRHCGGPSVREGWYCYEAIHGSHVDMSFYVTCANISNTV